MSSAVDRRARRGPHPGALVVAQANGRWAGWGAAAPRL